jgi:hypothetical protein
MGRVRRCITTLFLAIGEVIGQCVIEFSEVKEPDHSLIGGLMDEYSVEER